MQKPGSVKTILFTLYAQLAYLLVMIGLTFASPKNEDVSMNAIVVSIVIMAALIALGIYFVNKRKYMPLLLVLLALFLLSGNNPITSLLIVIAIIMLFPKSSRAYFGKLPMGALAPKPVAQAAPVKSAEGTEDGGEGQDEASVEEQADKPSPLMRAADIEVDIREAGPDDAETVHRLMLAAFEEYRAAIPPSSALEETEQSVRDELASGAGHAVLLYEGDEPVAMARYRVEDDGIYFYRLSVLPSKRRRGYAARLIAWLETTGLGKGLRYSRCKVRQSVQSNLRMYQDRGYEIVDQELVVRPEGTVKALKLEKKIGA